MRGPPAFHGGVGKQVVPTPPVRDARPIAAAHPGPRKESLMNTFASLMDLVARAPLTAGPGPVDRAFAWGALLLLVLLVVWNGRDGGASP